MNTIKSMTVLVLLMFVEICRSDPLDTWTWRNPLLTGHRLSPVASGGGKFVAFDSDDGTTILMSTNGSNWIHR